MNFSALHNAYMDADRHEFAYAKRGVCIECGCKYGHTTGCPEDTAEETEQQETTTQEEQQ